MGLVLPRLPTNFQATSAGDKFSMFTSLRGDETLYEFWVIHHPSANRLGIALRLAEIAYVP